MAEVIEMSHNPQNPVMIYTDDTFTYLAFGSCVLVSELAEVLAGLPQSAMFAVGWTTCLGQDCGDTCHDLSKFVTTLGIIVDPDEADE